MGLKLLFCSVFYVVVRTYGHSVSAGSGKDFLIEDIITNKDIISTLRDGGKSNQCELINDAQKTISSSYFMEDVTKDNKKGQTNILKTSDFLLESEESRRENIFSLLSQPFLISSSISNEKCLEEIKIFLHELKKYKLWAMKMYDASGKLQSGILQGNMNHLGDFDQCLSVEGMYEEITVLGKYCLSSIDVNPITSNENPTNRFLYEAVSLAQAKGFVHSSNKDPAHFIPRWTTTNFAVCIPASCSALDLEVSLKDLLQDYNITSGLQFNVRVDPDMCYTKKNTEHHYIIYFFISMLVIAVLSTISDNSTETFKVGKLERILQAFSFRRTITDLMSVPLEQDDIYCIHGIRALLTVALYLSHKLLAAGATPYYNRMDYTEKSNETWSMVFRSSVVYTDSFLLISGVLTSYNLTKEIESKKRINWKKRYIARFIRLTPALLAIVLFYAYIWENLGIGPLWNQVVKRNADLCKKYMWRNILYIQNFYPMEDMCATHTHQLALDMQLFLISPILVYLLYKYKIFGTTILLLMSAVSSLLRYLAVLNNNLSLIIYHGASVSQLYRTANLTYILSTHRATPYITGVTLGYILRRKKYTNISTKMVLAGWILSLYIAYLCIFSMSEMTSTDYQHDVKKSAIYAAFSPIGWSIALSWLIFSCHHGYGGILNSILCWRGLVLLSKISYSVYLVQFIVFFYSVGTVRAPQHFSVFSLIFNIEELLAVFAVSLLTTLLFDLPMQEVKNILMENEPTQKIKK